MLRLASRMILGLLTVSLLASTAGALSMGIILNHTNAWWKWGDDYLPEGRQPVRNQVLLFGDLQGYEHLEPLWPRVFVGSTQIPTTSRLIQYDGTDADYLQGTDRLVLPFDGNARLRFEITPDDGYAWPTEPFRIYTGGAATGPPTGGFGAYPAMTDYFAVRDPKVDIPDDTWASQNWYTNDGEGNGRWGDVYVIPGKDYSHSSNPIPRNKQWGLWANAGDTVEIRLPIDPWIGVKEWATGDVVWQVDGNGLPGTAGTYDPSIPKYAFMAGMITQEGLTSEEVLRGVRNRVVHLGATGTGIYRFEAPVDGFVGVRANFDFPYDQNRLTAGPGTGMWRGYFDFEARVVEVVPEPGTLTLIGAGLLGLGAVARRRRSVREAGTRS